MSISFAPGARAHVAAIVVLFLLLVFPGFSRGQGPVRGNAQGERTETGQSEKTYAPIGDSGYKVRIPEFKLKRIIGDQPKPKPPSGPQDEKPAPSEVRPPSTESVKPDVPGPRPRLPFDRGPVGPSAPVSSPADEQPSPAPAPVEDPQAYREPSAPAVEDSERVQDSEKERLRQDGHKRESPLKEVPLESEAPATEPEASTAPPKEHRSPVFTPPKAPEELLKPPPPPKKEVLPREKEKIPPLLGVQASKSKPVGDRVEPVEVDDMADPRGWLPLVSRGEPQSVAPLESEQAGEMAAEKKDADAEGRESSPATLSREAPQVAEPKQQARLEPAPLPEPTPEKKLDLEPSAEPPVEERPEPKPEAVPMPIPKPEPVPEVTPEPERQPAPEATPETKPAPEETAPTESIPPPAPREMITSPLDDDAVTSGEVRDYLRATAPILEELSLLMTRGPSLALSDYDPSDPNAPVIPKQIHLQMEWMKRELQVLDSKTFAIIPPKKYGEFHELIRQSIAQTYQACDAVLAYLAESKPENLKKMHQHLLKARDLIQRTTEKTGTS